VEQFRTLQGLVNELSGIVLVDDARLTVERKLAERVQALQLADFGEYVHYLRDHPLRKVERERVLDALTTNETYFFRELSQLRAFENEVLPALSRSAHARRALTVWSAGCSTGEEVYSLAILIARSGLFEGWDVRVVGQDISRRVLQAARRGVYRESSFRAMPAEYEQHFIAAPEGRAVDPEIRAVCHFEHVNLLDQTAMRGLGRADAVFCRNVLIYLDAASRRRVIQGFYERLHPEGYLMLGHSESLLHVSTAFELAHLCGDLAYRKPVAEPVLAAPGRPIE
jgi:chemotaxis protein methyltransferase CheR